MRVLTLTPFYPSASDDAEGCFVAEPLRAMREFGVNSCVVAVQPLHRSRAGSDATTPVATWIGYPSIPGGIGLASAGMLLYASLISKARKLHRSQRIDLIHAHAAHDLLPSPPAKRTDHLLIQPDISCANDMQELSPVVSK